MSNDNTKTKFMELDTIPTSKITPLEFYLSKICGVYEHENSFVTKIKFFNGFTYIIPSVKENFNIDPLKVHLIIEQIYCDFKKNSLLMPKDL